MYDCVEQSSPRFVRPSGGTGRRLNWWALGLAGIAALVMALCIKPVPVSVPATTGGPQTAPQAAPQAVPASPGPTEISLLEPVAKACAGLLIVYAAGWGLVRMRRGRARIPGGWMAGLSFGRADESLPRLRISETLSLGRQHGTLHLVEVEDTTLLVGVVMDQLQVLWTSVPETCLRADEGGAADRLCADVTATLAPVADDPPPASPVIAWDDLARPLQAAVGRGMERPVRAESDWAQERGRLISALMKGDTALDDGERS